MDTCGTDAISPDDGNQELRCILAVQFSRCGCHDHGAYYNAATNTKHVMYRSGDGRLHELWWIPGGPWNYVDLTQFAGAPFVVLSEYRQRHRWQDGHKFVTIEKRQAVQPAVSR